MNYKDYKNEYIGDSDIASLTLRCPDSASILNFGEDGSYYAYVVDKNAEIGSHYREVYRCKYWLRIYDDSSLAKKFYGEEIIIYRAGDFGCIIQIIE